VNIRSVANPISAVDALTQVERKNVNLNESHQDRDADGRRQQEEPDQSPLSDQEMQRALEYLEKLEGLKNNGLTFKVEVRGQIRIILISDTSGNIVRRIPEHEMRLLISDKTPGTGRIFHKTG